MSDPNIRIDIATQSLQLREGSRVVCEWLVSTSKFGVGERNGSFQTPRGRHVVRAKVGAGAPYGSVFVGRRPTGEIYSDALAREQPDRDWILTRILWLSGTEVGRNRLGDVDTMRRFIYIHGTPDSVTLGVPGSIGCVRAANDAVIELFERVAPGTTVDIVE